MSRTHVFKQRIRYFYFLSLLPCYMYSPSLFSLTYPLVSPLLRAQFPTTFVSWSDIVCVNIIDRFFNHFAIKILLVEMPEQNFRPSGIDKLPLTLPFNNRCVYLWKSFHFLYRIVIKNIMSWKRFSTEKRILETADQYDVLLSSVKIQQDENC